MRDAMMKEATVSASKLAQVNLVPHMPHVLDLPLACTFQGKSTDSNKRTTENRRYRRR
jgi:hypothetical protein